jgi:CRISPR-associated protein Cas1
LFVEKGRLDVLDGAFLLVDEGGIRMYMPIGGLVYLMLEPGTRVSHAAVLLAARAGTLLIWVGEAGVRLYAAGQPGGARADRLLLQARFALDDDMRLRVVQKCMRCDSKKTRRNDAQSISCVGSRACGCVRPIGCSRDATA